MGDGDGVEDVGEAGDSLEFVFFGTFGFEGGEVECGACVVGFDDFVDYVGDGEGVGVGYVYRRVGVCGNHGGVKVEPFGED